MLEGKTITLPRVVLADATRGFRLTLEAIKEYQNGPQSATLAEETLEKIYAIVSRDSKPLVLEVLTQSILNELKSGPPMPPPPYPDWDDPFERNF